MAKGTTGLILGAAALATAAVVFGGKKTTTRNGKRNGGDDVEHDYEVEPGKGWAWEYAPEAILSMAESIEDELGWVGLPEYLLAVAWTESKGNPYACSGVRGATADTPCPGNTARGWFQGRPTSMFTGELEGLPSVLLTVPSWSMATYVWYIWRTGHKYAGPGQTVDWLAVRRGAALPRLVKDVNETAIVNATKPGSDPPRKYRPGERSADVRHRLEDAVAAIGLDNDFIYERAFPPGVSWPGIDYVLEILDAPSPAEVLEAA